MIYKMNKFIYRIYLKSNLINQINIINHITKVTALSSRSVNVKKPFTIKQAQEKSVIVEIKLGLRDLRPLLLIPKHPY